MSRFSAYMRGQTGAQGPQGTPSIIDGVVSTTSQLPAQANEGSAYLVGTDAPKNLYIYINNEWVNQGSILGAGFGEPTGSIEIIPVDSYEEKTGSIVQFEKTQENKAEISELNIDINPVQDLHGYDNPWPAGGGKNQYNPAEAEQGVWLDTTTGETVDANGYWVTGYIPILPTHLTQEQRQGLTVFVFMTVVKFLFRAKHGMEEQRQLLRG